MRIQHNVMAMNAYRNYSNNTKALSKNLERLSSGYKINRAGDDAAGLAISEKMRAQITGLEAAQKNVKDGISLVNTAEGAMQEVQDMLNRMVYLAQESANGTFDNEVDRANLQKELEQLNSEIDRIADSANFNGIKLLDGSLGLNKDAFVKFENVDAVKATTGELTGSNLMVNKPTSMHLEVSGSATQTNPGVTIDFGSLAGTTTAANQTLKFNILGKDIIADLGAAAAKTANDIATAARTELLKSDIGVDKTTGKVHTGGAASNDAVKIGDFVFEVGAAANGEVTLTYAGHFEGATFETAGATANFTKDQADAINAALGQGVKKVAGGDADAVITGDVIHDTTKVTYAIAKSPSTMAGVDIDISDLVVNGGTLKIDGVEYYFHTEGDDPAVDNATKIDVTKGKTQAEKIHMAVDALSKLSVTATGDGAGRTWKIGSVNDTTIHIDQTAAATDTDNVLNTEAKLAAIISGKGEAVSAANAGTKITIVDSNVQEGNTLTVGEKQYVFTNDEDKYGTTEGNITYVKIEDGAAKNLADAISGSKFDETANTVTVYSNDPKATTGPEVLGKGLTLQIGDTSDSFNQLSVLVSDIHANKLGTGALNIGTQDGAAAAVDKIKAAINKISSIRGTLGATSNRLDHTANNLSVMRENITDAESAIRDTDIAEEMMAYTKNNILVQSAQAMLAQANQVPQGVLQLLQ